jgi:hypothetical protein
VLKGLTSVYFVIAKNTIGNQSSNEKSASPEELSSLIQYLKASNTDFNDFFGYSVSLSADGTALAVGAYKEDSNGVGFNSGAQADNSAGDSGAVYLFRSTGGVWAQEAYLKASNTDTGDSFGLSVSLSADGTALAVGAYREGSNGVGVNSGAQADNNTFYSGAVYVY